MIKPKRPAPATTARVLTAALAVEVEELPEAEEVVCLAVAEPLEDPEAPVNVLA